TQTTCDPAHSTLPSGCRLAGYKKAGTGCDDHNACTKKEQCISLGKDSSGNAVTRCGGGVPSPGARECDGNPCTTNDTCNNSGQCVAGTAAAPVGTVCDDGNVCTTTDRCAIVSGSPKCVGTAGTENLVCSDGNQCTNGDHRATGAGVGQVRTN